METLFILFFYVNYYLLSYETIPTLPTSAWSPLLSLALVLLSRSPVVLPSSLSLSLSFALVFSIRFPRIVSPTFRPTQTLLFPLHHHFHFHFHHHHQREKERERVREIEHAFAVSYYSLEHTPTISEFLSSLLIDRKREKETRKTRKRDFENVNTFPLKGVH